MKKLNLLVLTLLSLFSMYSQDDAIISLSCDEEKMEDESFRYDFELIGGEYVTDREGNEQSALKITENSGIRINRDFSTSSMPKYTITFWMKPTGYTEKELSSKDDKSIHIRELFSNDKNGGVRLYMRYFNLNHQKFQSLMLNVRSEASYDHESRYLIKRFYETDEWVFVAMSFDADRKRLLCFIDGKFKEFDIPNINAKQVVPHLSIGTLADGTLRSSFKGTLDDIKIYNEALSEKDISSIYELDYDLEVQNNQQYQYKKDSHEADILIRVGDIDYSNHSYRPRYNVFCDKGTNYHFSIDEFVDLKDYPGTDKLHVPTSYDNKEETPKDYYLKSKFSYEHTKKDKNKDSKDIVIKFPEVGIDIENVEFQIMLDNFGNIKDDNGTSSSFQFKLDNKRLLYVEEILRKVKIGKTNKLVHFGLLPQDFSLLKDGEVTLNIDDVHTGLGDGYIIDFIKILINPKKAVCQPFIDGYVRSKDGEPIANALVSTNSMINVLTDEEGFFEFDRLPIGINIVKVDHEKYFSQSMDFDLYGEEKEEVNFVLEKKPEKVVIPFKKEMEEKGSINLYGIYFESNGHVPTDKSNETLTQLADYIETHPGIKIEIIGHTDDVGNNEFNLNLSQKRAESVIKWLDTKNIKTSELIAKGLGEEHPVASNETEAGKRLNRRVELRIVK